MDYQFDCLLNLTCYITQKAHQKCALVRLWGFLRISLVRAYSCQSSPLLPIDYLSFRFFYFLIN